nr:MAG TPA: tail protein [Caudoviricetes sp.]
MIVQVYADKSLVYDNRLEGYGLLTLKVKAKAESGGTATLQLPPLHPAYSKFVSLKTLVEIYRNSELVFRGRALYPSDDFYGNRTITCESERCFFADAVIRPYLYQTDPATIFRDVIGIYNAHVDDYKQFAVGEITVTDDNDYVRMESESATQVTDVITKLIDRCGGYIVFGTNSEGQRTVSWYASLTHYSTQTIELGENLLDFASDDGNANDLATVLVPYGAKDEETGDRVTIESVNDGKDYVEAADAVAYRGRIVKVAIWDDVTKPENLLRKAIAYLSKAKLITTQLTLSAIDLSAMNKDIDTFSVGDLVHVKSKPHNVDDDYLLLERDYDLLNPANDSVAMGKSLDTLTGAAASDDRKQSGELDRVERDARADYEKNKALISGTETRLTSMIQQTSESIMLEVSRQEEETDNLKTRVTKIEQTADDVTIRVTKIEQDGVDKVSTSMGYTFSDDGLHIQKAGEEIDNTMDHTGMYVKRGDEVMLQANKDGVIATDVKVRNYLIIGTNARFEDYGDNRTACFYVGGES